MDGQSEHVADTARPYQIFCVLGGEWFNSGYMDKAEAEAALADKNKRAGEMGIKTRYILKEMTPPAAATPPEPLKAPEGA